MSRIYNFSAGPAMLPETVLSTASDALLDWHGIGMSIAEVPHRGIEFKEIMEESKQNLRELLTIPKNYRILFMQGGARLQFSMVPINLTDKCETAVYVDSGIWSQKAIEEAKRHCNLHIAASAKESNYTTIPNQNDWDVYKKAAYLYYVSNETANGLEFSFIPKTNLTLVCDMSSNLLSRPFDISRYGLVFACAQKNMGISGLTIIIIRKDLLNRNSILETPSFLHYSLHDKENSLWNTPPTFTWYITGLVFKWIKKQGGVLALSKRNSRKAKKLYDAIDSSGFYHNIIDPDYRSRMNVIFTLIDKNLNLLFSKEALKNGLANLKGHRLIGGMRASIYNAMPESGIDNLIDFMQYFEKKHG
ncbi:3-phosphoserine/phosphohydroxythreonine transaminase [Coxiella endosymbiont of Amblyomma americanum]|uniref:3-phosphoserine/phosphohydroxythreonine transaminase n=1 Tax=Coxiella endosymbiont of Amblyomma americanum TaxID=325775 RepID=UPI00057E4791|nr:3-phosphoserine/phosphohydroxythreonine transaminase [Coxiella endosymbiont of Amblyomma americanum]AJC50651.1 MFS transporter [Coxiella endosymbiont of Amblyomma americanum]AUJ58979.1 phosphoserine transaminase [Coxiella-like endosymbiont of Amblyomma americanum]